MPVLSINRTLLPSRPLQHSFLLSSYPRLRFRIPTAVSENEENSAKVDSEAFEDTGKDTVTGTVEEDPKELKMEAVAKEEAGSASGLFDGGLFERGMDPRLFGENVDPDVPLPSEFEKDIWESPKFEIVGTLMQYFVPALVVAGLCVGGIAAKSFNDGATSYLQPATSEEGAQIVPAEPQD